MRDAGLRSLVPEANAWLMPRYPFFNYRLISPLAPGLSQSRRCALPANRAVILAWTGSSGFSQQSQ